MLKDNIDALIKSAMLEKNNDRLETLRMIKSQILITEESGIVGVKIVKLKEEM